MTNVQDHVPAQSGPLTHLASQMLATVHPSVVQVRGEGHGNGAGVIWRTDGAIVTNDHVIGQAERLEVQLHDGRVFAAEVSARNASLDLALLHINGTNLPSALVGNSAELRIGELVFAIGHPWGQRDYVTAGIVSGLGELPVAGTNRTAQYVRSDVRLAPGNSGGPLVNARGEVIGINAMVFGGDLGVAIPSHVAIDWIAGLPSRGITLGVQVQTIELPPTLRLPQRQSRHNRALLVLNVEPDSLAERAGLFVGDALLEVDGTALEQVEDLRFALNHNAAAALRMRVLRGGTEQDVLVQS